MVLEDLHELVETLQRRIAEHGPALQQSEALTRYSLIDPLLRGLGWDTGDPSQVLPEYRSAAGSADYALLGLSGSPQVIVEAKKLGTHLDVKVRQQVTSYCQEEGVPFAVITDGRRWEIYDIFQRAAMKDSQVSSFDLGDQPAAICLQALALWRSSASAGNVKVGTAPLSSSPGSSTEVPVSPPIPVASPLEETGWTRLSEFSPEAGSRPSDLRCPDGRIISLTNWGDFMSELVAWLQVSGSLSDHDLPIQFGDQTQYVVSATPPTRMGFDGSGVYRKVGEWHVRTNYTGGQHAKNAVRTIELAGRDPGDFAVRLQ